MAKCWYDLNNQQVWQADARQMDMALDGSVDLVVTSPPYNCDVKYDSWNDGLPWPEYWRFTRRWLKECYRVLKDGGRIAINVPHLANARQPKGAGIETFVDKFIPAIRSVGFTMRECITWAKTPLQHERAIASESTAWGSWLSPKSPYCRSLAECILVAHKNSPSLLHTGQSDLTKEEFLLWTRNVWVINPETRRNHPAPFPKELPVRLIKLYTYVGDTVLDPFMGSGTTLRATADLGRRGIGVDISETYCKQAAYRIGQASMFAEAGDEPCRSMST